MNELADAVESLTYWRGRARRLPWYRPAARREAREMALRWESRVAHSALWTSGTPLRSRIAAGIAVASAKIERRRLRRWAAIGSAAAMAVLSLPFLLVGVLLTQLF